MPVSGTWSACHAGRVRFELVQPLDVDPFARHAVGLAALVDAFQRGQLRLVDRHDHLAAHLERDVLAAAEILHGQLAGAAVLGLERTRAGSRCRSAARRSCGRSDAGRAATSFSSTRDRLVGEAFEKAVRRGEADDTAADDYEVVGLHRMAVLIREREVEAGRRLTPRRQRAAPAVSRLYSIAGTVARSRGSCRSAARRAGRAGRD